MSKRFGRNQKRKLKAQLAAAEAALKRNVAYTSFHTNRVRELERERENVVRCLGKNFVGLDPQLLNFELGRWMRDSGQFECLSPLGTRETMHLLDYRTDEHRLLPQCEMHFRFRLADREVGYAISTAALHSIRVLAEYLTEQIARQMARMLVDDIRKLTGE